MQAGHNFWLCNSIRNFFLKNITLKKLTMNVKKLLSTLLVIICISIAMPAISNPITPETIMTDAPKIVDPLIRLQQIKDMTKENLSRSEKKELRKEVKEIKKEIKTSKNGVYLSVGAIIIIILLLILLL